MDSKRRVLLTGGSGFIGWHCIKPLLDRGYEVYATHYKRTPPALADVQWQSVNLLDRNETASVIDSIRPTHLLHLAWYVEPGSMISHNDNLTWLVSSLDLMRRFTEQGGRRMVVGGSCYEYDWRYGYCQEDLTPCRPDTLYGAAKNGLSQAMLAFAAAANISAAWARMFFLYGPQENSRRLVPSVILSLLNGQEAKSSHGEQIRDYMHVQDVANGMVALLDADARGAYNIASGRAVTIRQIVEEIGVLTGRTDLLRIGAIPARANDAPLVVGDPTLAFKDFGWKSTIGLADGLRTTIDWWRERHSGQ